MAADQRTLLHVIYAGRGDAFILEYTTVPDGLRRFVLVDGGPSNTGPPAFESIPYYKYLFHAIKDVWSKRLSGEDITVDAMVCSHAHADHIDGLRYILNSMDDTSSLLTFTGPFVYPRVVSDETAEMVAVFKKLNFVAAAEGWTADTIPGIRVDYPRPEEIAVYRRATKVPGVIDNDVVNLSSILMWTDPAATAGGGQGT